VRESHEQTMRQFAVRCACDGKPILLSGSAVHHTSLQSHRCSEHNIMWFKCTCLLCFLATFPCILTCETIPSFAGATMRRIVPGVPKQISDQATAGRRVRGATAAYALPPHSPQAKQTTQSKQTKQTLQANTSCALLLQLLPLAVSRSGWMHLHECGGGQPCRRRLPLHSSPLLRWWIALG